MAKKLFVGNLPYSTTDQDLKEVFAKFGAVTSAEVIMERENGRPTGRSRGFGFVTIEDDSAADAAVNELNDTDMGGRKLIVNEAKPMTPREDRRPSMAA